MQGNDLFNVFLITSKLKNHYESRMNEFYTDKDLERFMHSTFEEC